MSYFLQGFGVFLGVVAGTAVTLFAAWIIRVKEASHRKRNLIFEIGMNIRKLEQWLERLNELRNAVNGDALDSFYEYFDFSKILAATAISMYKSGELYKHLSHEEIDELHSFSSYFSSPGEQFIHNQISQHKRFFEESRLKDNLASWFKTGKPQAVSDIKFWEQKFKGHRDRLSEIIETLEEK
ncbi:MAG: hypothetical protein DRJ61_11435 [Acidobacteria bacterium]|nr:MAG: hypothetical protein DRJ61_11435 [Acidobacteriota bacterium]